MPTSSSTGSPRPDSRGGRCCRSDRRTTSARRTSLPPRSRAGAACSRTRRAKVEPEELEAFAAREAYWIADWAAFAGGDAIADQVRFAREWSALREYARQRGVRLIGDLPIYVAAGSADHVSHPRALLDRRGRGRPARRVHEGRPALGQPALRLVGAPRGRLPLVDRALPPHVRARRPDARRPLPRLRRLLGGPGRRGDGEIGAVAPGSRPQALRRRARGARRPAGDRRGPRRDHPRGRAPARRARAAGDARAAVGVLRPTPRARTASRTIARMASCTRARTTTTRRPGGGRR